GRKIGRTARVMTDSGQTIIDGFTVMRTNRLQLVFAGAEIAFGVKRGWTYVDDLTEADAMELAAAGYQNRTDRTRKPRPPGLPHELLRLLLSEVRNLREEGAAIVGDLPGRFGSVTEIDQYLRN